MKKYLCLIETDRGTYDIIVSYEFKEVIKSIKNICKSWLKYRDMIVEEYPISEIYNILDKNKFPDWYLDENDLKNFKLFCKYLPAKYIDYINEVKIIEIVNDFEILI